MAKEFFYDFGNCRVTVIRPDISSEERNSILDRALTRLYLDCLEDGVNISANCQKKKKPC